jgi:hypothetical protein
MKNIKVWIQNSKHQKCGFDAKELSKCMYLKEQFQFLRF